MEKNACYWIARLGLSEHPEGGFYVSTYRSDEQMKLEHLPPRFQGARAFCSAIYYLLESDRYSRLHRIKSDEMWHFYDGSSLTIYVIDEQGEFSERKLGRDPDRGESFQVLVRAGCWFGAAVDKEGSYSLVGCTVSPGFEYEDFELGDREKLLLEYPQHRLIIEKLTRP